MNCVAVVADIADLIETGFCCNVGVVVALAGSIHMPKSATDLHTLANIHTASDPWNRLKPSATRVVFWLSCR